MNFKEGNCALLQGTRTSLNGGHLRDLSVRMVGNPPELKLNAT